MTKVPFKTEELEAGDIISLQARHSRLNGHEYSRLYIFEVTKRLFKTVVLLDATANWKPGSIYNFQIIDLDNQSEKWVKLV
jgi:hypothetical protein